MVLFLLLPSPLLLFMTAYSSEQLPLASFIAVSPCWSCRITAFRRHLHLYFSSLYSLSWKLELSEMDKINNFGFSSSWPFHSFCVWWCVCVLVCVSLCVSDNTHLPWCLCRGQLRPCLRWVSLLFAATEQTGWLALDFWETCLSPASPWCWDCVRALP